MKPYKVSCMQPNYINKHPKFISNKGRIFVLVFIQDVFANIVWMKNCQLAHYTTVFDVYVIFIAPHAVKNFSSQRPCSVNILSLSETFNQLKFSHIFRTQDFLLLLLHFHTPPQVFNKSSPFYRVKRYQRNEIFDYARDTKIDQKNLQYRPFRQYE